MWTIYFPHFLIFAEINSINYGTDQNRQGSIERDHKKGILKLCKEWLEQTDKLINKEYDNHENAFDRCMEIAKRSNVFYKEAMMRENYYRTQMMLSGAAALLAQGYISLDDIADCREEIQSAIKQRIA